MTRILDQVSEVHVDNEYGVNRILDQVSEVHVDNEYGVTRILDQVSEVHVDNEYGVNRILDQVSEVAAYLVVDFCRLFLVSVVEFVSHIFGGGSRL